MAYINTTSNDNPIRILERFNEKVDRLNQRGFEEESRGGGAIVEWRRETGWDGLHIGPSEKTIEATVLTLRFFILNNESTSLRSLAKLYSSWNIDPKLCSQFSEVRRLVNCHLDSPSNLCISEDGPMTYGQIFYLFINGDLAHANDGTTENDYRAISQTAFFPFFQDDFINTVRLLISAFSEIRQINCLAIGQLRRGRATLSQ